MAAKKRKLDDIVAEPPSREALCTQLQPSFPSSQPPQLQPPISLNLESPYAIFSLFVSEEIIEFISQSTNEYAQRSQAKVESITAAEIKAFLGILIYMGVHQSPLVDLYWREDRKQGPLHLPRLYMSQTRFEQIKHYLHIPQPYIDEQQKDSKLPLASAFNKAVQKHYQPGSNINSSANSTSYTVDIENYFATIPLFKELRDLHCETRGTTLPATSTNAAISRVPFRYGVNKKLKIPIAINDYNHYMDGVDVANQYRASYEIDRPCDRNLLPILYSFLDAAIINAFRIQQVYKRQQQQQQQRTKRPSQLAFREKLYEELLAFAPANIAPNRYSETRNHQRIQLNKQQACVRCMDRRKKGELKSERAPRSTSGCLECGNVALCARGRCWEEFHSSR